MRLIKRTSNEVHSSRPPVTFVTSRFNSYLRLTGASDKNATKSNRGRLFCDDNINDNDTSA
ncbi:MAG: hypothetical protein R3Y53_09835 [Bacillota bacterium]